MKEKNTDNEKELYICVYIYENNFSLSLLMFRCPFDSLEALMASCGEYSSFVVYSERYIQHLHEVDTHSSPEPSRSKARSISIIFILLLFPSSCSRVARGSHSTGATALDRSNIIENERSVIPIPSFAAQRAILLRQTRAA